MIPRKSPLIFSSIYAHFNPLPDMPIFRSSDIAANKGTCMLLKEWTNGDKII